MDYSEAIESLADLMICGICGRCNTCLQADDILALLSDEDAERVMDDLERLASECWLEALEANGGSGENLLAVRREIAEQKRRGI